MSEIQRKFDSAADFTITPGALASGDARSSAVVDNTNQRPSANVHVKVTANGTPSAGATVEVWLLRDDNAGSVGGDDNWAGTDAAYPNPPDTPRNATLIGVLSAKGDANEVMKGTFPTDAAGPLGTGFGIAVYNRLGVALDNGAGDFEASYELNLPDIQ